MPFTIERNDLAAMDVDAIVVAANERLQITGGVGAAVAAAAGFDEMQAACDAIGFCPTGSAVATPGFRLPAKVVVHAVGPRWDDSQGDGAYCLRQAYDSALNCAFDEGAQSIALPLLSAGSYGFPPGLSLSVARDAIREFLDENEAEVYLVLYDRAALVAGLAAYGEVAAYIDDRYVEEASSYVSRRVEEASYREERRAEKALSFRDRLAERFGRGGGRKAEKAAFSIESPVEEQEGYELDLEEPADYSCAAPAPDSSVSPVFGSSFAVGAPAVPAAPPVPPEQTLLDAEAAPVMQETPAARKELADLLDALDAPFSTTLLALIDERGMTDSEVYKRANMSRQLFSKIRSDASYRPTKKTVLALAIALRLDLGEVADLLRRAGFALSHSSKADVIVEYYIAEGRYDIFEINEMLYAFDQPLL